MENSKYTIKNLVLFENLWFSKEESSNTTKLEYLYKYENKVSKAETNPNLNMFLTNEEFLGFGYYGQAFDDSEKSENQVDEKLNFIPQGKYLFLQGVGTKDDFELVEKAAETLFLESLWQEKNLKNTTYLRFLHEGEKIVFQLFREVEE